MTHDQFMQKLRARFAEHGSLRKYARHLGIGPSFLSQVALGHKAPSRKILNDMGLVMRKKVTRTYEYDFSEVVTSK